MAAVPNKHAVKVVNAALQDLLKQGLRIRPFFFSLSAFLLASTDRVARVFKIGNDRDERSQTVSIRCSVVGKTRISVADRSRGVVRSRLV